MRDLARRICAAVLLLACLLGNAGLASAANSKQEDTLRAFGIVREERETTAPVSWAEFTVMTVRLLGLEEAALAQQTGEGHWASGYAELAQRMGLFTGCGMWLGDEQISPRTAMAILVNALGYTVRAQSAGGLLDNYMQTGAALGLTKGAPESFDPPLTRAAAYAWLENALDVPILVQTGFNGKETFETKKGVTLRENLYSLNNRSYGRGIVEANGETGFSGKGTGKQDEVIISGQRYHCGETSTAMLLGYAVEFYAAYDEASGSAKIIWIKVDRDNEAVTVFAEDIVSFQNTEFIYDSGEGENKLKVPQSAVLIENGRAVTAYMGNKFDFSEGRFTLIDQNGDNMVDAVISQQMKSYLVERVTGTRLYLKQEQNQGIRILELDRNKKEETTVLEDENGNSIAAEDLTGRAVSVLESRDGSYLKIIRSGEPFRGTVEELTPSQHTVTIDGETYRYTDSAEGLYAGSYGLFWTDAWGKIFRFEQDVTEYAYLYQCDFPADSLDDTVRIKLFTQEKKFCVLKLADNVQIDGVRYANKRTLEPVLQTGSVITYKTNAAGEAVSLEHAQAYGEKGERYYRKYANGFNDPEGRLTPVLCDAGRTIVFYVPANGNEEDFYCDFPMEDGSKYVTCGYGFEEDGSYVRAVTVEMDTDMPFESGIISAGNLLAVDEVKLVTDSQDNITYRVCGWSDGAEAVFEAAQRQEVFNIISGLQCGDVIQFITDWNGRLVRVRQLLDISELDAPCYKNPGKDREALFGRVDEARLNILTDTRTWRTHEFLVNTGSEDVYKYVSASPEGDGSSNDKGFNRYFLYDAKRKRISAAQAEDIIPQSAGGADASQVYIGSSYGNVQFIVIFKETVSK